MLDFRAALNPSIVSADVVLVGRMIVRRYSCLIFLGTVEAVFTSGPAVIWCQILLSIYVDKVMLDLK